MCTGDGADAPDSNDSFYVALGKRLQRAYAFVCEQQDPERMASNNRERRALASKRLEFKMNDLVLYWEPQQRRLLHTDPLEDDTAITKRAPSKWTGPHCVLKRVDSKHRYTRNSSAA
jgi:hypothetical protein